MPQLITQDNERKVIAYDLALTNFFNNLLKFILFHPTLT